MFPGAFSGNPHPDHLVRSPEEGEGWGRNQWVSEWVREEASEWVSGEETSGCTNHV